MKLREIYKKDSMGKNLPISFEVFPPQDEAKTNELIDNLKILNKFNPSLISVTYGAGGSVRDRSESCM
ncbi:methylenetetrahydrofolate reductase [bacterium]|nr:methylenetetrahydrofolate reductase [bacterium]